MKSPLLFRYWNIDDSFKIQNNGHALAVNLAQHGYGEVWYDGGGFDVMGLNFHAPSEHTIRGRRLPLEVQIQHKRSESEHALVIAVLFDTTGHSTALAALSGVTLPGVGQAQTVDLKAPTDLLTPFLEGGVFFEYAGSFTEPPCTEQVTWLVRTVPMQASAEQVEAITQVILQATAGSGNWRSTMPRMGRPISVRAASPGAPPAPVSSSASPVHAVAEFNANSVAAGARRGAENAVEAGKLLSSMPDLAAQEAYLMANASLRALWPYTAWDSWQ